MLPRPLWDGYPKIVRTTASRCQISVHELSKIIAKKTEDRWIMPLANGSFFMALTPDEFLPLCDGSALANDPPIAITARSYAERMIQASYQP